MTNNDKLPGLLLIALGGLFLLANVTTIASLFGALLFFGGGAVFLAAYYRDRDKWWALIPGSVLLALGAAALSPFLSGSLFLGFIGAGFVAVYLSDLRRWWALIPGGILLTLALVAGAETLAPGWDAGPLLFLGFAATFTALYLLPPSAGGQRWALYPAVACIALAVLSSGFISGLASLWPLALIILGLYLMWQRGRLEGRS
jgi:hypothetical protein